MLITLATLFASVVLTACGGDDETLDDKIIYTGNVTDLSYFSASISVRVNSKILYNDVQEAGVSYGTTSEANDYTVTTNEMVENSFVVSLTNLSAGTQYYYRAYVKMNGIYYYSITQSFTTQSLNISVSTGEVKSLSSRTATLEGVLNADSKLVSSYGMSWGIAYRKQDSSSGETLSYSNNLTEWSFTVSLAKLSPETTYSYRAFVSVGKNTYYGETKTFTTNELITKGEKIDLGLSVKWGSCNVGSTSPEEHGDYYAWGETTAKSIYTIDTYTYFKNDNYVDIGSNISGTQYDVATAKKGGSWRMPTDDEYEELREKCSWIWDTYKNVAGYVVTGPNGNSIFLPTAGYKQGQILYGAGVYGYYWSGSIGTYYSDNARILGFYKGTAFSNDYYRYCGFVVRAVTDN